MSRATIDFGIDLGTTNSAIAILKGDIIQVFKNNDNSEYTPSAVWIDTQKRLFVGRAAKERVESDPENAHCEFKLQMGKSVNYRFAASGRTMKPEELSAEVLKSLKASVMQRTQEDVQTAVITVPAAFELDQCKATERAAQLAGFASAPLLQEPIAAALAYGFDSESDKVFWLVYDLGGGTFDAAVMQVRDGEIKVVNHGGDNHLGGKLIDWAIVEEMFIPAVLRKTPLRDFRRGNPKWLTAIAKLKYAAEQAKIQLAASDSFEVRIEFLCLDERGQPVSFEYELHRRDVEQRAEPFILRSINICKKILTERRLGVGDVEKVLLVGGPTLTPYLRERLADSRQGLGIRLDFSVDPLTVVAQGAAIFAGTQRVAQTETALMSQRQQGYFTISFPDWTFKGSDLEPSVAGTVKAPGGERLTDYTVEFINVDMRPPWRSGQVSLAPNGGFLTTLFARREDRTRFQVELRDRSGRLQPVRTDPETLNYTIGLTMTNAPLTHSVGVALANNEVEWLLEKGRPLPARGRAMLRTAFEVRQGQAGDVIRIPVVEGGNARADRNRRVGKLEVSAHQVKRNVPVGSEVEITIEIDASRLVRTKAFVPVLDEEFEAELKLGGEESAPDINRLKEELQQEKERLAKLRKTADPVARQTVQQIDDERIVRDVEGALDAAQVDPDAADKGDKRLLDLKVALDQAEEALEWPRLLEEAEGLLKASRDIVYQHGNQEHKNQFLRSEAEVRSAMQTHDVDLLKQRLDALRGVVVRMLDQLGVLPALAFEQLRGLKDQMRNPMQADRLIMEGQRALQAGNIDSLRTINQQLAELLPTPPPPPDLGTVLRGS